MRFEVALLRWSEDPNGEGVRLVGRSGDPSLVDLVRLHLQQRLGEETARDAEPAGTPELRLVWNDATSGSEPDRKS